MKVSILAICIGVVVLVSAHDLHEKTLADIDLDLTHQKARVMKELNWSSKFAEEVIEEYKKFWLLHLKYPEMDIVPSLDVDEIWHAHILFTRQYHDDCYRIFGHFLHHNPTTSEEERADGIQHYSEMLKVYEKEFGKVGSVWAAANEDGSAKNLSEPANCRAHCGAQCSASHNSTLNSSGCGAGCGGKLVKKSSGCGAGCGGKSVKDGNSASCGAGCGGNRNKAEKSAGCGSCSGKSGNIKAEKSASCGNCSGKSGLTKSDKSAGCGSCSGKSGKAKIEKSAGCGNCSGKSDHSKSKTENLQDVETAQESRAIQRLISRCPLCKSISKPNPTKVVEFIVVS